LADQTDPKQQPDEIKSRLDQVLATGKNPPENQPIREPYQVEDPAEQKPDPSLEIANLGVTPGPRNNNLDFDPSYRPDRAASKSTDSANGLMSPKSTASNSTGSASQFDVGQSPDYIPNKSIASSNSTFEPRRMNIDMDSSKTDPSFAVSSGDGSLSPSAITGPARSDFSSRPPATSIQNGSPPALKSPDLPIQNSYPVTPYAQIQPRKKTASLNVFPNQSQPATEFSGQPSATKISSGSNDGTGWPAAGSSAIRTADASQVGEFQQPVIATGGQLSDSVPISVRQGSGSYAPGSVSPLVPIDNHWQPPDSRAK
jgi:hypothetical protein